ncbi:hypothetical protein AS594_39295 [Streptomyces agglomeratus]|uniref:Uncharacterized protein n=1 Tax=Streptomyces agglomeratus TaxID=285458 RepID=A0A1E5NZ36_9ACTN|nr:hypothetical protein [Streptomyces agglomeratus]OEJ21580.1 hypothetical protein AS594_39295 [Streptomyces agglomeratus]
MTPTTLTRTAPAAPTDRSDLVHDIRLRTAASTGNPTQGVPQLLAHIEMLEQRLAAAEAVFPGITELAPGEPVELTIYRAEYEHGQLPLGLYTNRDAARAHGEDLRTREGLPTGAILTWIPDFGDDEAVEELAVFYPGEDDETQEDSSTGYLVTPLTLTAAHVPEVDA